MDRWYFCCDRDNPSQAGVEDAEPSGGHKRRFLTAWCFAASTAHHHHCTGNARRVPAVGAAIGGLLRQWLLRRAVFNLQPGARDRTSLVGSGAGVPDYMDEWESILRELTGGWKAWAAQSEDDDIKQN